MSRKLLEIRDDFFGRAHVRLGHDFQQRRPGAIQVDPARRWCRSHAGSSRHLLPDGHAVILTRFCCPPTAISIQPCSQIGDFVLRDLIALGKIGIEIVLPVELIVRADRAIQRQSRPHGHFHGLRD